MALLNIGTRNRDDPFYRYKMPKMITKIEGGGNGIKTNIVNMVGIAKALARPAVYPAKYFSLELGAPFKFDEKTGTCHVNGAHDSAKLVALLEEFIKKYVQCYGCGNPETEIVITKTQTIVLKCAACGYLSDVDMMREKKLNKFILKNATEGNKKGGKGVKKEAAKKKTKVSDEDHSPNDDDVQWQTDTSMEAAKQRMRDQLCPVTCELVMLDLNKDGG